MHSRVLATEVSVLMTGLIIIYAQTISQIFSVEKIQHTSLEFSIDTFLLYSTFIQM